MFKRASLPSNPIAFPTNSPKVSTTIGEQLRAVRESQKKSLAEIAKRIKISQPYLQALENGAYERLPSLVYAKQYLRSYAKILGLSWNDLAEQFNAELQRRRSVVISETVATRHRQQFAIAFRWLHIIRGDDAPPLYISKIFKVGVAVVISLLIAFYLIWEVIKFLTPPELIVFAPQSDMIVTEQTITVNGQSAPEALVAINGRSVALSKDGIFSEKVPLQTGLNTIKITTKTKRSQERMIIRNILLKPPVQITN